MGKKNGDMKHKSYVKGGKLAKMVNVGFLLHCL